jgi:hypothetical protein
MKELFSILLIISLCVACRRQDPNPENSDPIYSDIQNEISDAQKNLEAAEKDLDTAKKDIETAAPQTGELKIRRNAFFEAQKQRDKAEQQVHYLQIKLEKRKEAARRSYLKAFNEDKTWPDPSEYKDYLTHKRLTEAPRDWGQSLRERLNRPPEEGKKEKSQEH